MGQIEGDGDSAAPPDVVAVLHALLCDPGAVVAALGSGAIMGPMPASVPLRGQRVFVDGLGLDLVVPDDRIVVIEGWAQAQRQSIVRLNVHLRAEPDRVSTVHLLDLRAQHGAHLLVVASQDHEPLLRSVEARGAPRPGVAHARRDAASVFLDVDEATTLLLGYQPAELIGRSTVDLVHPDDVGRAIESWIAVRAGENGRRVRVRYRHAHGHHVWLEITNENRLEDPAFGCILSEMVDISAEMAQIEELRERERLLARLADALPIGVCHLRPDLRVVYSNAPLIALLGPVDTIGAFLRSIVSTDREQVKAALRRAFQGSPSDLELGVIGPVAGRRCELTFRAMTNEAGSIDGVIVCATDVTARCRLRAELEHRASHDLLTGCLNREAAVAAIGQALRESRYVAVAYIDLDDFKASNDAFGHATGDELLKVAAARLRAVTRGADQLARLGGDEFVVICRQDDLAFDRAALVRRLTEAIGGEVMLASQRIPLTASVGVAVARRGELDAEALLDRADRAMYNIKRRTRTDAAALARPISDIGPGFDIEVASTPS